MFWNLEEMKFINIDLFNDIDVKTGIMLRFYLTSSQNLRVITILSFHCGLVSDFMLDLVGGSFFSCMRFKGVFNSRLLCLSIDKHGQV